jgi:amino acid adenylation domain-containing protein
MLNSRRAAAEAAERNDAMTSDDDDVAYPLPVSASPRHAGRAESRVATIPAGDPPAEEEQVRLASAALAVVLHRYGARDEIVFPVSTGSGTRHAHLTVGPGPWTRLLADMRTHPQSDCVDHRGVSLTITAELGQPAASAAVTFSVAWRQSGAAVGVAGGELDSEDRARMAGHLAAALTAAIRDPDAEAVASVPLLPEEGRLAQTNAEPRKTFSPSGTLASRFRATAGRFPDRIAVSGATGHLSYVELLQRSEALAERLRDRGVGSGSVVGLAMPRGVDLIVGLVGIVLAGAAYVPVDPDYPTSRQQAIIDDAGITVLVTGDDIHNGQEREPSRLSGPAPHDVAYVIYTSGSTGRPKGVQVTHYNVLRLFDATAAEVRPVPEDVWTMFHSYAFDFSVWEIWGPLLHGGRLVVVPFEVSRNPVAFRRLVVDEGVTVLNQTPSAFLQFLATGDAEERDALRLVILGGEAVDPTRLAPWFASPRSRHARLVNMYGITETTVHVTWRVLTQPDTMSASSPLGMPLADLGVRLRDDLGRVPPVNIVGELLVTGAGLARGYLNSAELTAARFREDADGVRWYHSGDFAYLGPDGEFYYAGRGDRQVKIRGFRIELGDVEAALQRHPAVGRAVVLAATGPGGRATLAGFVASGQAGLTSGELRAFVRRRLPTHMIPAHLQVVTQLPLTVNGKVDTKSLLALLRPTSGDTEEPVGALDGPQGRLADIWTEILGVRPRAEDTFFDLGGDSLSLVSMLARADDAGIALTLADVFAGRNLADLVRDMGTGRAADPVDEVTTKEIWAGLPSGPPGAAQAVTVRLGRHADATPLYVTHWGTGNVSFIGRVPADPLADRDMVGVEAVGLHDGARPLVDPDEIVAHVAAAVINSGVRRVHLGGFCYGALVALATARTLTEAGIEVASLILADAVPPDPADPGREWTVDDFLRFRLSMVAQRYGTGRAKTLAQMAHLGVADPGESEERFLSLAALWAANSHAAARWRLVPFAGPVLLVASDAHRDDTTVEAWCDWLDPGEVTRLLCGDAPDSHDLVTSEAFHAGLHRFLRHLDAPDTEPDVDTP